MNLIKTFFLIIMMLAIVFFLSANSALVDIDILFHKFNQIQVNHWQRYTSPSLSSMQGSYLSPRVHAPNTLLPFELIKCVIKTYGYNQQYISSMLPKSRINHTWAAPIGDKVNTTNFDHARSIDDLKRVGLTKRSAINVATEYDTI